MATALIVCDFPILAMTAEELFADRYRIVRHTWQEALTSLLDDVELVIADVTNVPRTQLVAELMASHPGARIVVCSLDQNEVAVYRVGTNGLEMETEFDSLLALTA